MYIESACVRAHCNSVCILDQVCDSHSQGRGYGFHIFSLSMRLAFRVLTSDDKGTRSGTRSRTRFCGVPRLRQPVFFIKPPSRRPRKVVAWDANFKPNAYLWSKKSQDIMCFNSSIETHGTLAGFAGFFVQIKIKIQVHTEIHIEPYRGIRRY